VWSNQLPETALYHFLELVVFCFKNITPCLVIHKDLTRSTGNGSNVFHTHKYGCLLVPLSGSVMCEQLLLQFHSFGSLVAVCADHSHAPHCTTKHISTFPWIYSQERPQSVTVLCLIGISCETITFALNQSWVAQCISTFTALKCENLNNSRQVTMVMKFPCFQ